MYYYYSAIPSEILNLNVSTSLVNESVFLQWDPPDDNGGDVVSYIITVTPSPSTDTTDGRGCSCIDGTCVTNLTTCTLTKLTLGTNYTFNVLANNVVGMSDGVLVKVIPRGIIKS